MEHMSNYSTKLFHCSLLLVKVSISHVLHAYMVATCSPHTGRILFKENEFLIFKGHGQMESLTSAGAGLKPGEHGFRKYIRTVGARCQCYFWGPLLDIDVADLDPRSNASHTSSCPTKSLINTPSYVNEPMIS